MSKKKSENVVKKPAHVNLIAAIVSALPHSTKLELFNLLPKYYSQFDPVQIIQHTHIHKHSNAISPEFLNRLYKMRHNDTNNEYSNIHNGIDQFFQLYFHANTLSQSQIRNHLQIVTKQECKDAISNYKNAVKHIKKYGLGSFFNEIRNTDTDSITQEKTAISALLHPKTSDNERYQVLTYLANKFPDRQFTQVVAQSELGIEQNSEVKIPEKLQEIDESNLRRSENIPRH